jgi:hypothetical protein
VAAPASRLREARREANRTDPMEVRTPAEAKLLESIGHAAAARVAEAAAVALSPRHDPSRLSRLVSNARELLAEEDAVGARPLLEEARVLGRSGAPAALAAALPLLARLAADVGAFESIDLLADEAGSVTAEHPEARLRISTSQARSALARGDTPSAAAASTRSAASPTRSAAAATPPIASAACGSPELPAASIG